MTGSTPDEPRNGRDDVTLDTTLSAVLFFSLIGLGAATLYLSVGSSPLNWIVAAAHVPYAFIAGIIFAARGCGHDFEQSPDAPRPEPTKSRLVPWLVHLPILLPAWIAPPVVAGLRLMSAYDQTLAIVAGVFVIEAFVVFPIAARLAICRSCPQRGVCPWMSAKAWRTGRQ